MWSDTLHSSSPEPCFESTELWTALRAEKAEWDHSANKKGGLQTITAGNVDRRKSHSATFVLAALATPQPHDASDI